MNKQIIIGLLTIFVLVITISCVYADTTYGFVGRQTNLFSDVIDTDFYPATSANITVYAPNLTIVVNNEQMTNVRSGVFVYNFTPQTNGEYYTYTKFYNGSTLLGTGSSLLESQQPPILQGESNMGLVTIIAMGLCVAICLFIAFKIEKEHFALKLLLMLVSFTFLVLIAFNSIENDKVCGMVANGNTLTTICNSTNNVTPPIFFYGMLILYVIFIIYTIVYFIYYVLMYFKQRGAV